MASETLKEKAEQRRASVDDLEKLIAAADNESIPQLVNLLEAIADKITQDKMAQIFAEAVQNGNNEQKRTFFRIYTDFLKIHAKMTGDITHDEISRMSDQQLDTILYREMKPRWKQEWARELKAGA